jgi:DNA-binding transcriptional MerR regulator
VAADVNVEPEGLTIDELAVRTGTTTRTLRLYQTKSLLPPPRIVGRIGYYSEVHVNRLIIIDRLQKRGFSLAGIAELFKIWQQGKSLDELLGLEAQLTAPWNQERPELISQEDFAARYPRLVENPELMDRLKRLRLLLEDPKGYLVPTPVLFNFGEQLYHQGMPVDAAVQQMELLHEDVHRIAKRFVRMFRKHLLTTIAKGNPQDWLSSLAEWSERSRPGVRDLVMSAFTRAMDEEIESFQLSDKAAEVQSSAEHEAELAESRGDEPSDPDADPSVDSAERH